MNVSVHYKRGQRQPRSTARARILGDGLLERARSTSLALLGVTAAVGLAMVALALNQGWPLIAGAPIPGFGDEHQAVGDATVAAEAQAPGRLGRAIQASGGRQSPKAASTRPPRKGAGATPGLAGSRSPGSEATLVSHSTPAGSPGDSSPGSEAPAPEPVAQQPTAAVAPAPSPEPTPAAVPPPTSSAPQPAPEPPAPSRPSGTSSESEERDHGHHYGRGSGRGYHYSRDRDDSDEPEEDPSLTPSPPVTRPTDSDTPEEPEESYTPPWSSGGDHDHDHDYGHYRGRR
jgi:hypothetical protein